MEIKLEKEMFENALNEMDVEYKKGIARGDKQKPDTLNTFWDLLHPKAESEGLSLCY